MLEILHTTALLLNEQLMIKNVNLNWIICSRDLVLFLHYIKYKIGIYIGAESRMLKTYLSNIK